MRFVLVALAVCKGLPAQAQDPWPWWFYNGPDASGVLTNCPGTDVGGDVCLAFSCGGPMGDTIRVYTWAEHLPERSDVVFRLDDRDTMRASLSRTWAEDLGDSYTTLIGRTTLLGLMDRMQRASQLALRFDVTTLNRPALSGVSLAGVTAPLGQFVAHCNGQPAAASPSPGAAPASRLAEVLENDPESDLGRYVSIARVAQAGAEARAQARALLAARIAENQVSDVDVLADLIPFNDGQRVLLVSLCHPTNFGITGCETHLFHQAKGAERFVPVWGEVIGPGPQWLDLQSARDGLPDLVWGPTSVSPVYVRWPMFGADVN